MSLSRETSKTRTVLRTIVEEHWYGTPEERKNDSEDINVENDEEDN